MKKIFIIAVAIIVLAGVAGIGFLLPGSKSVEREETVSTPAAPAFTAAKPTVNAVPVTVDSLEETISVNGSLSPRARVAVLPKAQGRVAAVSVGVGDYVQRGELITQLEADELALQVEQAKASLEVARANLNRLKAGARPEEIDQAESALEQARASFANAEANYHRASRLYEEGVMSGQEWEGIRTQYEVAKAQLESAEKSLALLVQGARAEDIQSAEASVRQAEAALRLAELAYQNTFVTAPISGYINSVNVELGSMAGSTSPVAEIVDIDTLELGVKVSEMDVVKIQPGQTAQISFNALPSLVVIGRVSEVAPAAEPGGLFPVTIEMDNGDGLLKPGLYARARIVIRERPNTLTVPTDAVFRRNGRSMVFGIEDGVLKQTEVETGLEVGGRVEILGGLEPGQLVVSGGQQGLKDGLEVDVVERGDRQ